MRNAAYLIIGCLLFSAFFLLFYEIRILRRISRLLKRTKDDVAAASRQRMLEQRKRLIELEEKHSLLFAMEKTLQYSGLKRRFPGLTPEWWIAGNALFGALIFGGGLLFFSPWTAAAATALLWAAEAVWIRLLRTKNLRSVSENLLKLLDFLGNYSVTAAEAAGVFGQVSRYLEEPLRSALDACCYEAQTTGDAGLALLSMAEKIEHPKLKELARNMEVSIRYCADFSALVRSSRRSLREYLRLTQKRRGMLREAAVNMALLMGMSAVILTTVGVLTGQSLETLLFQTLPGRVGAVILAVIFAAFAGQLYKAQN